MTGNFSKYIPHNATRFEVETDDRDVKALGFTHNERTVLILINPSDKEKSFVLPEDAVIAVTDKTRNLEEYTAQKYTDIKLSPKSVNTVVFTEI